MTLRGTPGRKGSRERRFPLRYGRVFFDARKRLELSTKECLLLDVIETLSRRTGWCYASRAYLAGVLGVSKRTLQRMLRRLLDRELLETRSEGSRELRVTDQWRGARTGTRR